MAVKLYTLASKATVTAGTRVQVSTTDLYVLSLAVQSKKANTGKIYVGDASVSATQCHQLEPGETIVIEGQGKPNSLEEVNVADVYFDSSINAEGVNLTYIKRRPT